MNSSETLRFRRSGAILVAALMGFICTLPVVFGPELPADPGTAATGTATVRWYLLPVLLIPVAVAVWGWRTGTDADRNGVRVRALLGQRQIGWSQISELAADRRGRAAALLTDGRRVALPAVNRTDLPDLVAASGQRLRPSNR